MQCGACKICYQILLMHHLELVLFNVSAHDLEDQ